MTNQVQKITKNTSVSSILQHKDFKKQLMDALPRHMTPERMSRIALTELRRTPKLQQCDSMSFLGAVVQCAQIGLEPGNNMGHAYLLPYGKECTLIIGYKGLIELARRSGQIASINAREVRENDKFEMEYGLDEKLRHVPATGDRGKLIGFYAIAKFREGGAQFEYMTIDEIEKIKKTSKSSSYKDSPWNTFYEEMAKKTLIRRLVKYLPISVEIQTAVSLDEQADSGSQRNSTVIDYDDIQNDNDLHVVVEKEEIPADKKEDEPVKEPTQMDIESAWENAQKKHDENLKKYSSDTDAMHAKDDPIVKG